MPNHSHPLKTWRLSQGWFQADLADAAQCSKMSVCRAERGEHISRQLIDKFVEMGAGALKKDDFQERRPRRKTNGTKSKTRRQKARIGKKR